MKDGIAAKVKGFQAHGECGNHGRPPLVIVAALGHLAPRGRLADKITNHDDTRLLGLDVFALCERALQMSDIFPCGIPTGSCVSLPSFANRKASSG